MRSRLITFLSAKDKEAEAPRSLTACVPEHLSSKGADYFTQNGSGRAASKLTLTQIVPGLPGDGQSARHPFIGRVKPGGQWFLDNAGRGLGPSHLEERPLPRPKVMVVSIMDCYNIAVIAFKVPDPHLLGGPQDEVWYLCACVSPRGFSRAVSIL